MSVRCGTEMPVQLQVMISPNREVPALTGIGNGLVIRLMGLVSSGNTKTAWQTVPKHRQPGRRGIGFRSDGQDSFDSRLFDGERRHEMDFIADGGQVAGSTAD